LNGNLNFRILSIFLAWDLSMQSRTDLWSHLGYLRIGVNNTVLRFWLRRCRDSVSKVILFTNIHSNSPQRSVNLLCKLVTVNTWRPPAHMRPLAWSQSIFMTKRWERMLMTERWRENMSLSLPELGGNDDSVISSQSVSDSWSSICPSVWLMESMTLWTSTFLWLSSSLQNWHVELSLCRKLKSRGLTDTWTDTLSGVSAVTRLRVSPTSIETRRTNKTDFTIPQGPGLLTIVVVYEELQSAGCSVNS